MSDFPKAGWSGHVIDGGWDTRHARPAGEVTTPDLVADVAVDALVAALERAKKAEAELAKAYERGLHDAWSVLGQPFIWARPENPYQAAGGAR